MSELKAGKVLEHYRIVRKLGAGGMADVYEAEDLKLGRTVALKVLPPELMRNPQLATRFKTEVRAAASLNHRSIVTVFEVGEHDGIHFYSMRLLTGGDLRRRIRDGMRSVDALAVLRELSGAFEHAHSRGFVHRDVKPENILFDGEGLPVLTDFGIAKALGSDSQLTGTGVSIGTPRYFSPEQARGRKVDARSDLYSLGIILYEMLTGEPPYVSEDAVAIVFQHVNDPIPTLPEEHAHLQPLLEALMAKDPDQRIGSARELRHVISTLGGFGLTPQPINLGEESELVQRLLAGGASANRSPTPMTPMPRKTSATATVFNAPDVSPPPPVRGGEIYEVADDEEEAAPDVDEDATVRRPPPPRKGETVAKAPAPPPAPKAPQALIINRPPRRPDPVETSGGGALKWIAAGVLVVASAVGGFIVRKGSTPEAAKAPAVQKVVPAPQPTVVETPAPAAKAPEPAQATVAPAPAPQVVKSAPAPKPAPAPEPKVAKPAAQAPQPQVVKSAPATTAPAATFTPAPAAQPAPAPAPEPAAQKAQPAPQEEAVAPKPAPRPEAAKPKPAAKPAPAPEESDDEDEFLRERAEQLRIERERREAARKKEEELRRQEESQQ